MELMRFEGESGFGPYGFGFGIKGCSVPPNIPDNAQPYIFTDPIIGFAFKGEETLTRDHYFAFASLAQIRRWFHVDGFLDWCRHTPDHGVLFAWYDAPNDATWVGEYQAVFLISRAVRRYRCPLESAVPFLLGDMP